MNPSHDFLLEKKKEPMVFRLVIPHIDPGLIELNQHQHRKLKRQDRLVENIKQGNTLASVKQINEEDDDEDANEIMESVQGINLEKMVDDHLELANFYYKFQIRNIKNPKFFLQFDLSLEEKGLNFQNATVVRPPRSSESTPTGYSELAKQPYSIYGERFMKGKYINDFKAMLKSIGVDDDFHIQAVELTKEYEKMLYRQWMANLLTFFSETNRNAK